jgi:F-type H+-transporting ATPase subunit b
MRFDWWTLALQTVNFAVLVWLLHRFLYKPVLRLVDARRAEVQQQYDAAKAAEEKAEAHRAAAQSEEASIAAARKAMLKAAAAQAEEAAKARRAQVEREAAALLDATRKTLATERDQALAEARRAALDLGTEVARRLLAELPTNLRAAAWLQRIEQHLAAMPAREREALVGQLADGASLQVVTASPLPAEAAEAWCSQLHRTLGDSIPVVFDTNPDLVAGAELHFPNAVLRVSWQNALAAVRSEIEAHANAR